VAATEASFERNGSLGFIGGMGSLPLLWAFIAQKVLRFLLLGDCEEVEADGSEEAMGKRRAEAMDSGVWVRVSVNVFSVVKISENPRNGVVVILDSGEDWGWWVGS